jgi:hypothetical protein
MHELECPVCGRWNDIDDFQIQVDCTECQSSLIVDRDAEFINGSWRDRTKLLVVESMFPSSFKEWLKQPSFLIQ